MMRKASDQSTPTADHLPARLRLVGLALAAALIAPSASPAAENGGWIDTWAASTQPVWEPDFIAPINFPRNLWNQTIRQVAREPRRRPDPRGSFERVRDGP